MPFACDRPAVAARIVGLAIRLSNVAVLPAARTW
jgi:hypothetical protein